MAIFAIVENKEIDKGILPWWTWLVPLVIFQVGFWISSFFKTTDGPSLFYLPIAFGIILVHWWGPRVILPMFISSLLNILWLKIEPSLIIFIMATHGPVCIFLSWFLFRLKYKGGSQIADINHLYWFVIFGIFIPVSINAGYELAITWNEPDPLRGVLQVMMPDLVTNFAFTLPILLYTTPFMSRAGLTMYPDNSNFSAKALIKRISLMEFAIIAIPLLILSFIVPFDKYWYIYGVMALYTAARFGFEGALAANLFIFLITYLLPIIVGHHLEMYEESNLINVHLGMCMLYISATVTGRVISDVKDAREELESHNKELEVANQLLKQTNGELDRFVYSVSHDLSAPLKSVKGLISLSRYESDGAQLHGYMDKIHSSVSRLEKFILDILDYSRNNRQEISLQELKISVLVREVVENLEHIENSQKIQIKTDGLLHDTITVDPTRLRIILNNLIGNAIKYHQIDRVNPFISISSRLDGSTVYLEIKDNGEGMSKDVQARVFEMFYRGTTRSVGSGLGLYIAKESAEKIKAKLTLQSEVGIGSSFVLTLPVN